MLTLVRIKLNRRKEEIISKYLDGDSCLKLAVEHGVAPSTLKDWLLYQGISIRSRAEAAVLLAKKTDNDELAKYLPTPEEIRYRAEAAKRKHIRDRLAETNVDYPKSPGKTMLNEIPIVNIVRRK